MRSHRFDPVSAVLGLVVVVVGIAVVAGATVPLDADLGPWLAITALAFGILLLPWGTRRAPEAHLDPVPDPDPFA